MADKRIIEQNASTTVPNDAFFIFDSALLGTFKISQSALLDFFGNATITEVTKAQYDALPDTKLTDGVLYAIKDQETSYVVDIEVDGSSILDEDGIADLSVISKIEEEIANAIAEEYDSTHTYYNTGLVFHEGVLYQCTATSTTGTWDSTKWNVVDIKDLLDNVSINIGYLWNIISNTIAGNYDTSSTYNTGDYAIYSLKLYRCKDDGVTGAWNSSKWEEVNIPEYIDYVLENAGKVDDVKVDGTSVVTNKVAEIEIPVKDVQVKTDSTYDSVVDASGNAKIDLSSVTAYGEVPNLPQAIASFKDGADAPMKSLKVAIEPQQEGSGDPSPTNIRPISGWDKVNVTRTGKNLIPTGTSTTKGYVDNSYLNADGTIGSDNTLFISEYFKVPSDVDCAWSSKNAVIYNLVSVCFYDENKNYISGTALAKATKIITTPSNATYCRSTQSKNENNKFQFEIGSTPSSYEAYNGQTYTIDLDGTHYGGEVDVVSGVLTVDRAYVDLGTLTWSNLDSSSGVYRYQTTINNMKTKDARSMNIVCSRYKTKFGGGAYDDGTIYNVPSPNRLVIVTSLYSNVTDFKNSLSGQTAIYELATPLTIQLTPTAVKSLLGSNNVWADTGDINECVYRRDMSSTIDDIIARLEALENA